MTDQQISDSTPITVSTTAQADTQRRFAGVARLYGEAGAGRLVGAHVCVVGIGGVGSWVVEALARTAIGKLTLIDLDMVAESNTNRQLHALGDEYGKAKVEAMASRVLAINPNCVVRCIEDFITPENTATLLNQGFDMVIDAIDQVKSKIAMLAWCRAQGVPIITVGAAGGKLDPNQIEVADLACAEQDPLLSKIRAQLRRHHQLPRAPKKSGITCVFSREAMRYPNTSNTTSQNHSCALTGGDGHPSSSPTAAPSAPQGLNCAGFGSAVAVTASFGFAAAGWAINQIAQGKK